MVRETAQGLEIRDRRGMEDNRMDLSKPRGGERRNFIERAIEEDLASADGSMEITTRFPPEPNGFLHLGHAKAICINFGIAATYGGVCNLRFDDTNPSREETRYVEAIKEDIRWLGFDWHERLFFASGYFQQLYDWAEFLINKGKAYVCDLDPDEIRKFRGTFTESGKDSPNRDRGVEENLDLFRRMRAGEFADGTRTLRAKIDMASPHLVLRDPVMYRIMKADHHRTRDEWPIYPMYDWAHGQSDAIEGISHSLCSLEFENHRPLYDWYTENLELESPPRQIEFARLEVTYTLTSKRKLRHLVEEGHVSGWDDPRMPTLKGMRRRGVPPEAICNFCEEVGVAKFRSTIDMVRLENAIRDHLNPRALRRFGVLDPIKVVITNYPEGQQETIEAINNPEDSAAGTRQVTFSRELWIERADFREEAPRKFFRLVPGREVRLRYAYCITCDEVVKDPDSGEVVELRCSYDPQSSGGRTSDGRKVKGIIHWVSAIDSFEAEVRIYDHLFASPRPEEVTEGQDFTTNLNPDSLIVKRARLEAALESASPGERFQFERVGYFTLDEVDSGAAGAVFNRIVALRDSWAKIEKRKK